MAANKLKVYEGVACLEIASAYGSRWWYQGGALAYTPVLIDEIRTIRTGILEGSGRRVLVIPMKMGRAEELVVVNLARSDLPALRRRGLIPHDVALPYDEVIYSPWPAYATTPGGHPDRSALSLQ